MEYYERSFEHTRIHVYVLGDWHYGSPRCDEKLLDKLIEIIGNDELGYWIGLGDLCENNLEGSAGSVYEQILTPEEQIYGKKGLSGKLEKKGLIQLLSPIAHKGLFMVEGNHGYRTTKVSGLVPDRIICDNLRIPFMGIGCLGKLKIKDTQRNSYRMFKFLAHHGFGGGRTVGGKINSAMRIRELAPTVDFTLSGHTHVISRTSKVWFDITQGAVKKWDSPIYEGRGWDYVCGSLLSYSGSYAERRVMPPAMKGQIMIALTTEGDTKVQHFTIIN